MPITCACGRPLSDYERKTFYRRPTCPDCGGRGRSFELPRSWFAWLFRRRKPQQPRYTPERPGPRYFSADYGFTPTATTQFTQDAAEKLRLTKKKNRWRFDQI
jgi:hypothetical protein